MVPQRLEKVFETACAAEGAKSLQNRWDVTVCPNIVAQIRQHIKHTWPTIASTGNGDEPPKRTRATRPRERLRERESVCVLPTPYLLILGGMCLQLSRRYGLHAWRSYFSLAVRF